MTKKDLRIVFMGTPEFAVESLKALIENDYNVVAVVTQPDKPVGRHGSILQAPAVKQYAQSYNIPVLQPEKMRDNAFVESLRSFQPDLQVVVAFRMLPEVIWAMPKFGTFNVHASLLPKYRGAAPINWAIINGETETGVTTFFLDHEIDTGRIIFQEKCEISETDDVGTLYYRLMLMGAAICLKTVDAIIETDGKVSTTAQPSFPNGEVGLLAPKIFKDTCRIDWGKNAREIYDFVRGLSPSPAAWTMVNDQPTKIYKVSVAESSSSPLAVQTNNGVLVIESLQLAGKKRMDASAFLNGLHNKQVIIE